MTLFTFNDLKVHSVFLLLLSNCAGVQKDLKSAEFPAVRFSLFYAMITRNSIKTFRCVETSHASQQLQACDLFLNMETFPLKFRY